MIATILIGTACGFAAFTIALLIASRKRNDDARTWLDPHWKESHRLKAAEIVQLQRIAAALESPHER